MANAAERHLAQVGMLISQLQVLELSARVAILKLTGSRSDVDLSTVQIGEWVQENPLTDYRTLRPVLTQFNEHAPPASQLDVAKLVGLRDQLAHGRLIAPRYDFPVTLLKFGRPTAAGKVRVLARSEMTEEWFDGQRTLVDSAIEIVGNVSLRP